MLAAVALSWATAVSAVGWVGIPLILNDVVEVPNLVGLSATDADIAAEAVGLDTAVVLMRCSAEPADEVLEQDPIAGQFVALATVIDLETSTGVACLWDLTGIPIGWYSIARAEADRDFVALMRQEANGNGVWAYWQPGTTIRNRSQLRLNIAAIQAEADGAAVWARWAPGVGIRNTGNLQLNMQEALNADFQ
jgi:hypothetical protein